MIGRSSRLADLMTGRSSHLAEVAKRIERNARSRQVRAMQASLAIQATMLTLWLIRLAIRARDVRRKRRALAAPTDA